jgi:1-acyl-sn-glycerol-3-phosphate acyltransferase
MQIGLFADSIYRHELGQHGTVFPEGTRNKGDPLQIMDLEPGVGILAFKAMRKGLAMRILPTALAYPQDRWHGASVFVGKAINPTGLSIANINMELAERLQACVTESNRA